MISLTHLMKDFKYILKQIRSVPCKPPQIEIHPKIHIERSKYISSEIFTYLHDKIQQSFTFIDNDGIIVMYTYDSNDLTITKAKKWYTYIRAVLYVCKKYSDITCASPTIRIYMTPFLKSIDNTILGPSEINSGYTRLCGGGGNDIVVYRKEEWLKVCIHECIHYFGLDFSNIDTNIYVPLMKGIFNIVSDHLLYESYTEFWAEMLYLCLYSVETGKRMNGLISIELHHSIENCKHILQNANITYLDVLHTTSKKNTKRFIEHTNVFCYYFLKTLYVYYLDDFLQWNIKNNTTLLSISKNPNIIKDLCKWIYIKSKQPEFIKIMSYSNDTMNSHRRLNKSLKMMRHS